MTNSPQINKTYQISNCPTEIQHPIQDLLTPSGSAILMFWPLALSNLYLMYTFPAYLSCAHCALLMLGVSGKFLLCNSCVNSLLALVTCLPILPVHVCRQVDRQIFYSIGTATVDGFFLLSKHLIYSLLSRYKENFKKYKVLLKKIAYPMYKLMWGVFRHSFQVSSKSVIWFLIEVDTFSIAMYSVQSFGHCATLCKKSFWVEGWSLRQQCKLCTWSTSGDKCPKNVPWPLIQHMPNLSLS